MMKKALTLSLLAIALSVPKRIQQRPHAIEQRFRRRF